MAKGSSATIKDVAKHAGVSWQTVSRVLNSHPNVKDAVRERVRHAIAELGYVPNLSARRMSGARSYLILAVNDRQRTLQNWEAGHGNDWVDRMLYGGITECERHNYHFMFELVGTEQDQAVNQLSALTSSLRPDGVILTPPHCDSAALVKLLRDRNIAFARVGHRTGEDCVDVYMDEEGAAARATEHLIELGHRSLCFVAGAPHYGSSARRVTGFQAAAAEAGLPSNAVRVCTGDFRFDVAEVEIARILQEPQRPTGIITDNDEMAFAGLHVADSLGLKVPDDLSLISFEDTPGGRFSVPPLTAVHQPTASMIAKACSQLISLARGEEGFGAFEVPFELVKRASTARARRTSPSWSASRPNRAGRGSGLRPLLRTSELI